ncbi:MAG: hypothetical protein HQ549_05100, partial [Candidatus Omnitrophica bacterium]|nr:hypothetical protein [Candidatus Omnitrophota bacterium]
MKYFKILLTAIIITNLAIGSAYPQPEKPIVETPTKILTLDRLSLKTQEIAIIEEDEDAANMFLKGNRHGHEIRKIGSFVDIGKKNFLKGPSLKIPVSTKSQPIKKAPKTKPELIKIKETTIKDFAGRVGVRSDDPRISVNRFKKVRGIYYVDLAFDASADPYHLQHPLFAEGYYTVQIINNKIAIREIKYLNASEKYIVRLDYNAYGILVSQVTTGEKLGVAAGYHYVKERYTRTATVIDDYGTILEEITHGEKLDPNNMITEKY